MLHEIKLRELILIKSCISVAISFSEFVIATVTFSCFGKEELLRFCFNCFDPERNGCIDLSDYNVMSRILHARSSITHDIHALGSNVEKVLDRMTSWVQDDQRIDFDEFVESNALYPWILKPAEKFRRKIREATTFGDDWWRDRVEQLHWARQAKIELLKGAEKRKNRWEESRQSRGKSPRTMQLFLYSYLLLTYCRCLKQISGRFAEEWAHLSFTFAQCSVLALC